jgi:hypothetical protein
METPDVNSGTKVFERRYDHYWKYLAVYSVALLIYSFVQATISKNSLTLVWKEPIFILISVFVIYSLLRLVYTVYKKMSIHIGENFIEFRNRLRTRRYEKDEILMITVGKERLINIREEFKVIKFKVEGRRRVIRIRPSSFYDDTDLLGEIIRLKEHLSV